ncbi:LysM peptidoglycan-binding domain-containing protein [Saxibacter everestensis]|uniref:LysM peptidoglycan-binding domain-containing protein n=1 Tax=Saxibacter everestensis TaxID=2909229 RepID=A0ABY8QW43_9MICO|nr:LysM peptidoglycan-binding domain-containing protein [Brevibacteriaceae bacterium ZFBP1038]
MTYVPTGTRLPTRGGPSPAERRREIVKGLLATLGAVVVVLGIPAALVFFIGNPLPTEPPSMSWLTRGLSVDAIINVIAVVVWIAWAHFTVCLIVEFRSARRGKGLPGRMLLGGSGQMAARRLVAAILLLAGAATFAPGLQDAPAQGSQTVAEQTTKIQDADAAIEKALAENSAAESAESGKEAAADKVITYTVHPPQGRHYDTLWDISERYLGDPLRYKEIYQLNKDQTQADGRKLHDADLIHPGWVLEMPADAVGKGLHVSEKTPASVPGSGRDGDVETVDAADTGAAASLSGAISDGISGSVATSSASSKVSAGADDASADGIRLGIGSALLAAGLLTALSARRGPYGAPGEGEAALRVAANGELAAAINKSLRHLAAARTEQQRPLPEVSVAYCSTERIVLHLIGSVEDCVEPPTPWTLSENGRSWTADLADFPDETPDVAAPYPALVNVAQAHGFELLMDLEAAPGLVAVGGDDTVAREVVSSIAVELATNGWSDGVNVTMVGFGDDLSSLAQASITHARALSEVLDEIVQESEARTKLLSQLGIEGVLTGRQSREVGRSKPRVLVLSGQPTPGEAEQLQRLVGSGRTPLAVICLGAAPSARWQIVAEADGQLGCKVLGLRGEARRLAREDYLSVIDLLKSADARRAELSEEIAALTPGEAARRRLAVHPDGDDSGTGHVPSPGAALPEPSAVLNAPAAVMVHLLGTVRVEAVAAPDEAQRPLLTEIVVAAALHPEGLHDAVFRSSIWPRGASQDVIDGAVAKVQSWLGVDGSGLPRFRTRDDGMWVLSDDVRTDWDVLCALAAAASGGNELATLQAALGLGDGEAFSGTPAGRYGWFAFHKAAREARVVTVAVARRAAGLAEGNGRNDDAVAALRQAIVLVPASEVLWRDLLRLVGGNDPGAASSVADEMYRALERARISLPEPETDALVDQLAPGYRAATA